MLQEKRREQALDRKDLEELRLRKSRGKEVDDDLLHELELFER